MLKKSLFLILFFMASPLFAFAQTASTSPSPATNDFNLQTEITKQLVAGGEKNGAGFLGAKDPRVLVMEIIKVVLTTLGMIFVGLVVLGGYWRLTAEGEDENVEKGNKTISMATIGLLIILVSYAFVTLISTKIYKAVLPESQTENTY